MHRSDVPPALEQQIRGELDLLGDRVHDLLLSKNLADHASPLFRPFGVVVAVQPTRVVAIFLEQAGMPNQLFLDHTNPPESYVAPEALVGQVQAQLNVRVVALFVLDGTTATPAQREATRNRLAAQHIADIDRSLTLSKLGDLRGFEHLEPQLRQFLTDHPDPERNVFIIMRFNSTPQFSELYEAISETLSAHGLDGMRADGRDYHPDLWSNVEIYMLGCKYGIAAFEDFEARDHNPNVALELGYMRARQKRCLILKERTLPSVPTDIVGSLYKVFDKFKIDETVRAQVERWITVDLGLGPRP